MPDSDGGYTFDLHKPHPNVDIDTMRRTVVEALAGIDDTYWLSDLLFSLLDAALADLAAAAAERDQCRDDLTSLTARLDALEARLPPVEPQPEPDPEVP